MSDRRPKLHETLCNVLSCPISGPDCRAYYQAPSSGMQYPSIVYDFDDVDIKHADNKAYVSTRRYAVTLIDKDPDSPLVEELLKTLLTIKFNRHYKSDNLHHFVFTIYY